MAKHEAQQRLADYIEEYTGKLIHQGESIESFTELWKTFPAVKAGSRACSNLSLRGELYQSIGIDIHVSRG